MATKVKVKKKKVGAGPSSSKRKRLTVIKTEMVPIDTLNKYYKNPRIGDVEKVAESLDNNGQFKPIVVNIGTMTGRPNEILGGNHTFMAAKKLKWSEIFVAWVDVDETAATKIVLADNGTSDGSKYDDSILTELLSGIKDAGASLVGTTYSDDVLNRLVKNDYSDERTQVDKIEDAPEDLAGVAGLENGIFFESDLPYDMPALLPNMIPDKPPSPIDVFAGHEVDGEDKREDWEDIYWLAVWHTGCRGINWNKAIACFYTEDFHFEPVFNDPAKNTKKILNLRMPYAMMPNYSISPFMPVATWVWAAYRSFYVARYFQEAGIQVIPDIQTGSDDAVLDLTLLGIPENCGVVAAQVQTTSGSSKEYIRKKARLLKEAEDRLKFKNIIIYGHKAADEVCERAGFDANVIRVENRTSRRREYLNSGSTINTQKVSGVKKRKVKRSKD